MSKRVRKVLMLVVLVSLVFSAAGCLKSDKAKVEETVKTFYSALKNQDKAAIEGVLDITMDNRAELLQTFETIFLTSEPKTVTYSINEITITGDVAIVSAVVNWVVVEMDGTETTWTGLENPELIKRDKKWKIVDFN